MPHEPTLERNLDILMPLQQIEACESKFRRNLRKGNRATGRHPVACHQSQICYCSRLRCEVGCGVKSGVVSSPESLSEAIDGVEMLREGDSALGEGRQCRERKSPA